MADAGFLSKGLAGDTLPVSPAEEKEKKVMNEVWKDIEGFEGKYQVSSWGRIRSINGIMKTYENKKGYLKIGLCKNGKCHKRRVNRLVAQAFIPNPYGLPQVNHIDGNKKNNSVTNLEWMTDSANKRHDKLFRLKLEEGKW